MEQFAVWGSPPPRNPRIPINLDFSEAIALLCLSTNWWHVMALHLCMPAKLAPSTDGPTGRPAPSTAPVAGGLCRRSQ